VNALIHRAPRRWEVGNRDLPAPREGEALFRVLRTGFCASDWKIYLGLKPARSGVIPGHEIAVEVVEDPSGRWRPGIQGSLYPIEFCGTCPACRRGLEQHCVKKVSLGYARDGGFATHILAPAHLFVPATVGDPEWFVFAEPLATVLWGLARVDRGEVARVGIWGLGPMGLLHAMVLAQWGVTVVGVDPRPGRQETARPWVHRQGPEGDLDLVVVATGNRDALEEALESVRPGGQVLLFSSYYRENGVCPANRVHYENLRVIGTHSAPFRMMKEAMTWFQQGLDPRPLITHRFTLETVEEFLATYERMEVLKGVFIPENKEG